MFLYVKLVMKNLHSCGTLEDIENETAAANFPRGIEEVQVAKFSTSE